MGQEIRSSVLSKSYLKGLVSLCYIGELIMPEQPEMNQQQAMQMFQQKLGNLELTVQALLNILDEEDVVSQDEINERAQEIVQEMQEQQGEMEGQPDHDHDHEE